MPLVAERGETEAVAHASRRHELPDSERTFGGECLRVVAAFDEAHADEPGRDALLAKDPLHHRPVCGEATAGEAEASPFQAPNCDARVQGTVERRPFERTKRGRQLAEVLSKERVVEPVVAFRRRRGDRLARLTELRERFRAPARRERFGGATAMVVGLLDERRRAGRDRRTIEEAVEISAHLRRSGLAGGRRRSARLSGASRSRRHGGERREYGGADEPIRCRTRRHY